MVPQKDAVVKEDKRDVMTNGSTPASTQKRSAWNKPPLPAVSVDVDLTGDATHPTQEPKQTQDASKKHVLILDPTNDEFKKNES